MTSAAKPKLTRKEQQEIYQRKLQRLENFGVTLRFEYKFDFKGKGWKFDAAITCCSIAIEVEGGIWLKKGHTGGKKYQDDMHKYNRATSQGWKVFRFSPKDLEELEHVAVLADYFEFFPCPHSEVLKNV